MMGVLADRTNTRWGKFRPWVLWTARAVGHRDGPRVHHARASGATGKLMWACLTNVLLMTLYSANNTPYSAMSGVMTGDVDERTQPLVVSASSRRCSRSSSSAASRCRSSPSSATATTRRAGR